MSCIIYVTYHMPHITCHMSYITRHILYTTHHISYISYIIYKISDNDYMMIQSSSYSADSLTTPSCHGHSFSCSSTVP